jgi:NADH dehydrogenase
MDSLDKRPKVVIVGGGFGGLYAAKGLANRPVSVTLVDRKNHHTFQPLLYQVATSVLSPGEIATPLRHTLYKAKNVEVILGEVTGFDTAARRVPLDGGESWSSTTSSSRPARATPTSATTSGSTTRRG